MLIVTIAEKKEYKGISKLVEEVLSEEGAQPLKFGRWTDVNQAKRKGRDLCSIFIMETHILRKGKTTSSKHTCQPKTVTGIWGKRERECVGLNWATIRYLFSVRVTF